MIADQLRRVTGVPVTGQAFFAQVSSFGQGIREIRPATVAVAAAVLAFLVLLHWRWPRAPGPLLAVLLATAIVVAFRLSSHGISVVGTVPAGLPVPRLPGLHPQVLRELLLPAFTVLIVGFSDDVLTARSFARASCAADRSLRIAVRSGGSAVAASVTSDLLTRGTQPAAEGGLPVQIRDLRGISRNRAAFLRVTQFGQLGPCRPISVASGPVSYLLPAGEGPGARRQVSRDRVTESCCTTCGTQRWFPWPRQWPRRSSPGERRGRAASTVPCPAAVGCLIAGA